MNKPLTLLIVVVALALLASCESSTTTEPTSIETLGPEAVDGSDEVQKDDAQPVGPNNPDGVGESEGEEKEPTVQPDSSPPPMYLSLTVHLEGWPVDKREGFEKYVSLIREYSDLSHQYGARFTWETQNLIQPSIDFGDNILKELQVERGDGVGIHADAGGKADQQGLSQESFTAEIQGMKESMESLGVEVRHVSGICSELDWVSAAIDAGYEGVTATVEYCLKSLPYEQQPENVKSCTNPSACHDPYPSLISEKLHPWRVVDGKSWTSPDPAGNLLLMHSSGALPCLAESASASDSKTKCQWDQADVDEAMLQIEEALAARQSDKLNHFVLVWSFGGAIDQELLGQLLIRIEEKVKAGEVVWKTIPELVDLTTEWEAAQQ